MDPIPKWPDLAIRVTLALFWTLLAAGGVAAFLSGSDWVVDVVGWWRFVAGTTLIVAGLIAAWASATNRYGPEWVTSWVVVGGLAPFIITSWVIAADSGHYMRAVLLTALAVGVLGRGVVCAGLAARLRVARQAVINHERP